MTQAHHTLLICTVGGSNEPLVHSLCTWRPDRVLFVSSEQTSEKIGSILNAYAAREGKPLNPGQHDTCETKNAQSLKETLEAIRERDGEVENWLMRGPDYRVVADFTAGTKCMSAALALQARRWTCIFSYVGGERRTKEGLGVVETGFEQALYSANPWDALGYQAIEDAIVLFDRHAYGPAAALLQRAIQAAAEPAVKRTLATFLSLCAAHDKWERFQHKDAAKELANVLKNRNDLAEILGSKERANRLAAHLENLQQHLNRVALKAASFPLVCDLIANARRRAEEGRFDDAVARLYRAIEALGQARLSEEYDIDPSRAPLEKIPEEARDRWKAQVQDGHVKLSLQDDYALLLVLDDELGKRFANSILADPEKSLLTARNNSILAHGFQPVGEKVFNLLWKATLELAQIDEMELLQPQKLANKDA